MPHDGRAIANFVLDHADRVGLEITNLKLQKLVYFCHVWSWIEHEKPLIRHNFEAWQNGPVLPYLYRDFKEFGSSPINTRARALNLQTGVKELATCELGPSTRELLERVLSFYGRLNTHVLVSLTHAKDGPWYKVWNHQDQVRPGMKISDADICHFYARMPALIPTH